MTDAWSAVSAAPPIRLHEKLDQGHLVRIALPELGPSNMRLICLTSSLLGEMTEAGTFLKCLYAQIEVVEFEIPPLRKRAEDIPTLVEYCLEDFNQLFQSSRPLPGSSILNRMREYAWPGKIRELKNLMMRYVIKGNEDAFSGELGGRASPPPPSTMSPRQPLALNKAARQVVQEFERKVIRKVLEDHHWNRRETRRALRISYRALLYKIKDAGVPPKRNTSSRWGGHAPSSISLAPNTPGDKVKPS